jgi:hypothetical protein
MTKDVLHVVPNGDGWAVKKEGNERASSTHDTQKNAIEGARSLAKEGDDIVIHRADGSIRDRITYNGGAINGGDDRPDRPEAHDLVSVGTRVRWGPVVAGVVVALAVGALLTALATAIGLSTIDRSTSGRTIAATAGVVWLFIMAVSMFAGGCVATRTTTRETKTEALILGTLVWGTTAALMALGIGSSMHSNLDSNQTAATVASGKPFWHDLGWTEDQGKRFEGMADTDRVRKDLNLNDEQAQKYEDYRNKQREAASSVRNITPQEAAWWTLAGLLISIAASIGGALAGAGPDVSRRFFARRAPARPAATAPAREPAHSS